LAFAVVVVERVTILHYQRISSNNFAFSAHSKLYLCIDSALKEMSAG